MKLPFFHQGAKRKLLLSSILIAFVIAFIFVIVDAFQEWNAPQLYLKISMKSSVDAIAQVFYDIGNGLNEKDSIICTVYKATGFQVLRFPLPKKSVRYIRFDPLNKEGSIIVKEVEFVDEFGHTIQSFDLKILGSLHQIKCIAIENNRLIAETDKNANDPMLFLNIDYPLSLNTLYSFSDILNYNMKKIMDKAPKKLFITFFLSWIAILFAISEIWNNKNQVNLN